MKFFVAGGTGAIGRPLVARLLAKGHSVVALTRSTETTQALVEQGVEPAIADVFDPDAVKAVVARAKPEVVIETLTALPRTYTREAMSAAAPFQHSHSFGRRRKRADSRASSRRASLPAAVDRILGGPWSRVGK